MQGVKWALVWMVDPESPSCESASVEGECGWFRQALWPPDCPPAMAWLFGPVPQTHDCCQSEGSAFWPDTGALPSSPPLLRTHCSGPRLSRCEWPPTSGPLTTTLLLSPVPPAPSGRLPSTSGLSDAPACSSFHSFVPSPHRPVHWPHAKPSPRYLSYRNKRDTSLLSEAPGRFGGVDQAQAWPFPAGEPGAETTGSLGAEGAPGGGLTHPGGSRS